MHENKTMNTDNDDMMRFVTALWELIELRSYGITSDELDKSVDALIRQKAKIYPRRNRKELGEALAGLTLNKIVGFSRDWTAAVGNAEADEISVKEQVEKLQLKKAMIIRTVCQLDRVYGINAQKLLSIADHFWKSMASPECC